MKIAATIRELARAGLNIHQIIDAIERIEEATTADRRAADRERQRRCRDRQRHAVTRDTTVENIENPDSVTRDTTVENIENLSRVTVSAKEGGFPPAPPFPQENIPPSPPSGDIPPRVSGHAPPVPKPGKVARRLPDDWTLPDDWREWALEQGVAPDVVTWEGDKFRDFWQAKGGQNARKVDWEKTWRNWIRRVIDDGRHNRQQRDQTPEERQAQIRREMLEGYRNVVEGLGTRGYVAPERR